MNALIEFRQPEPDTRDQSAKLLDQWLFDRPRRTYRMYKHAVDSCSKHANRPALDLNLQDVQDWTLDLRQRGASERTINYYQRILHNWFEFAVAQEAMRFNPMRGLRVPRKIKSVEVDRALSVDEVRKLIAAVRKPGDRFAVELLYQGGLRASELLGLRWRDISFSGEYSDTAVLDVLGKGGKRRKVRIGGQMAKFLLEHQLPPEYLIYPRSYEHLRLVIKRAAIRAGLPEGVSPHWTRHSRCTHLIMAGVQTHEVQDFMGHENSNTTDIYVHNLYRRAMPDTLESDDE